MFYFIFAVIFLVGALSFIDYRKRLIKKQTQLIEGFLPKDNTLHWSLPSSVDSYLNLFTNTNGEWTVSLDDSENKKSDQTNIYEETKISKKNIKEGIWSASADGLINSIPEMYLYSQIDSHVLNAIDFAFKDDLTNFNNLHDFIHDHYFNAVSEQSAEGWLTRLEGYVNEKYTIEILEKLGHTVESAADPTQKGWDLIVDGEHWQVKGGNSPEVITEHFDKFPDIPVFTNDGLAEHFIGNDQVVGLDHLNPTLIHQQTEQTLNSIDSLGNIHFHVPIITLIKSSYRELTLLNEGHTDFLTSTKNVALDIAGTGVGGLVGAKVGAAIGAFGGPIGLVAGAVIGGIGGAVTGRLTTDQIKQQPLKEAISKYERRFDESKLKIENHEKKEQQKLENYVLEINQNLNHSINMIVDKYKNTISSHQEFISYKKLEFVSNAPNIVKEIKQELVLSQSMLNERRKRRFLLSKFLPNKEDIFFKKANSWFQERYDILDKAYERFNGYSNGNFNVEEGYKDIHTFFQFYKVHNEDLNKTLSDILKEVNEIENLRKETKKKLFKLVEKGDRNIKEMTTNTLGSINQFLQKQINIINKQKENVSSELKKLGKELN